MNPDDAQALASCIEIAISWNIRGMADEVLKQIREDAADSGREAIEEWRDCGDDVLRENVYYAVMSRDPQHAKLVVEAVRVLVIAILELQP
jgi:hypothetical protein